MANNSIFPELTQDPAPTPRRHLANALARVGPAASVLVALMALLALIAPGQAGSTALFVVESFARLAPILALALLLAAYAEAAGADAVVARAFRGHLLPTVLAAAALGTFSPFCSCGVVPLIAALLALGMPIPAIMAFWLASPLMDPEMFVLTAAVLGLDFALAKTAAAFAIGTAAGLATAALQSTGLVPERIAIEAGCGTRARLAKGPVWAFWRLPERRLRFVRALAANARRLLPWLALAFALESLMVAHLPAELVGRALGAESAFAVPLAALVGIPAYVNGYAALPAVAAMIELGMTPGAALAFLAAGGMTSLPAALAVQAVAPRPVFLAYLAFALAGALFAGWTWQAAAVLAG